MGISRSKADFSKNMLGRAKHYLRLVEQRRSSISFETIRNLIHRLVELSQLLPTEVGIRVMAMVVRIRAAQDIARYLKR